ncbi:hypothetical protein [Streptomyces sp. NPDC002851]
MFLLEERFLPVAVVTEELSAALAEARHSDSLPVLERLGQQGLINRLIVAWADLLAQPWPSGAVAFRQVRQEAPQTTWLPHAEALVDAAASSDIAWIRRACSDTLHDLDDNSLFGMLGVMAQGVRQTLSVAGGMERLLECARLHHACAGPQLSVPPYIGMVSPAAWVIAANSAGHYEDAWERTATLIGSRADALEAVTALWLQVTAQVMLQAEGILVEIDPDTGMPLAVVEPGSDHPQMASASLIQTALDALHQQDAAQLEQATREIAALDGGDKMALNWQLARNLGQRVSQFLTQPS